MNWRRRAALVLVAARIDSAGVSIVAGEEFRADAKAGIAGGTGGAYVSVVAWGVVETLCEVTAKVRRACTGLAGTDSGVSAVRWASPRTGSFDATVARRAGIAVVALEVLRGSSAAHTFAVGLAGVLCGAWQAIIACAICHWVKDAPVGFRGAGIKRTGVSILAFQGRYALAFSIVALVSECAWVVVLALCSKGKRGGGATRFRLTRRFQAVGKCFAKDGGPVAPGFSTRVGTRARVAVIAFIAP